MKDATDRFTAALVTKDPRQIPDWVEPALEAAGIRLKLRRCRDRGQLLAVAGDADVVWTVAANKCVTADVLPDLPRCKAIMRSGSGLDDIPVEAARARGIIVANTPEAIAETVAEHTVALLMALARQVPQHDRAVRAGRWKSGSAWARWHVPGQTLGLIGFGLIAREVVAMLRGFKMKVLAYDPYADDALFSDHGAERATLSEVLQSADFVSVHCPLTTETHHLLGAGEFAAMKPDALLINTSRGGVLDEQALIAALQAGRPAGAALDVFDPEPPAHDNPLLQMENVILTPHVAAFSDEFEQKFWAASIAKLKRLKSIIQGDPS